LYHGIGSVSQKSICLLTLNNLLEIYCMSDVSPEVDAIEVDTVEIGKFNNIV